MIGTVLGLCFGAGLILLLSAFVVPRASPTSDSRGSRSERLLAEAGLAGTRPGHVIVACCATGASAGLLMQVASRTAPVALMFAGIGAYLPIALLRGRARRRLRALAVVWPETVDNLASAVRAGLSLPEALGALARRGPEALRGYFASFALDYQVSGRFGDSLDRLKERLADPVGDQVVEALRVAREVGGGDLGRLLRELSGFLREDARTRSELEARQAWTVNGARLAVAAPWLVLILLCLQPDVIRRYDTPVGVLVLTGGAIGCLVAYRLMARLGQLPTEQRVLS
ncbi:MAG TPA: type II secretion system F family protein [Marmoricola sp.]